MVRPWRDDDAAMREKRKDFWRLFLRDPSSRTRYYCWKLARAKTNRARRRDVLAIDADRLRLLGFLGFLFSRAAGEIQPQGESAGEHQQYQGRH
jgi:hypothetical protein